MGANNIVDADSMEITMEVEGSSRAELGPPSTSKNADDFSFLVNAVDGLRLQPRMTVIRLRSTVDRLDKPSSYVTSKVGFSEP